MSIDKATVVKIAGLARLKVPESEQDQVAKELNNILRFVEQLNEVDVTGGAPMTSVVEASLRSRPDVVNDGGHPEKALLNAPKSAADFFVVPKVVE